MKIIALYLPQFHEIPENNEMWGKGFTEWTNVKNAKPLYEGHMQPVEPYDDNYYDLSDVEVMRWQANLAKSYGVYGFCFYHYWYNGHLLLEKPILNFLKEKSININYCLCWANHKWTTSWKPGEEKIIYEQDYSDRGDWKKHFEWYLPFFKDSRYISNNNKPLLVLYEAARIPEMNEMLDYWNKLAVQNGFAGLEYAYEGSNPDTIPGFDDSRFTYDIEYQPQYVRNFGFNDVNLKNKIVGALKNLNDKTFKFKVGKVFAFLQNKEEVLMTYDYDDLWQRVIRSKPMSQKSVPGAFVGMDTTPRKGKRGIVIKGMTPQKFKKYLKMQIEHAKSVYNQDMIFLFAWNEWAEGGYLEPDTTWGYQVLEAIKEALIETNEMP